MTTIIQAFGTAVILLATLALLLFPLAKYRFKKHFLTGYFSVYLGAAILLMLWMLFSPPAKQSYLLFEVMFFTCLGIFGYYNSCRFLK
ncbi:hypothetical protein PY95_13395 [Lacticaseibacillus rhamnosus]|nr:hypothetical protein PY95_13395 [Lacticaseibacillus rhamnosus]OAT96029.1 hypothetical protein PY72_13395 [Lacticaseibacillus rhamnosus]